MGTGVGGVREAPKAFQNGLLSRASPFVAWDSSLPHFHIMSDIRGDYLTVAEIARLEQVSRARVHQLMQAYDVQPVRLAAMLLISKEEYRKIPPKKEREKLKGGYHLHKCRRNGQAT